MTAEEMYDLWRNLKNFINKRDIEEATYTFLSYIGEYDEEMMDELKKIAIFEDDRLFLKIIKELNETYDEDEVEEW